jgi:hypothetical protein
LLCNRQMNKRPFLNNVSVNTSRGNDIRAIARQPPIKTIEEILDAVFPVGSAPRTPGRLSESVEGWPLSLALQGRLRRGGAIVELTFEFCTDGCDKRT